MFNELKCVAAQGPYGAGHYVAYVMSDDGSWLVANDTIVTRGLSFEPVRRAVATSCYMLFYSR